MNVLLRRRLLQGLACGALAPSLWSQATTTASAPPELSAALPGARLQGQGRLRFFGFRVYEAKLWVGAQGLADGVANLISTPFALELDYERDLNGKQVAERSLEEMKRQGDVSAEIATRWLGAMQTLFPDIKKGDRLSALNVPGLGARFFMNGSPLGDVRDADFVRVFFGIWLSPKTSQPALRDALLGRVAP
jgi:hypothetical protein